MQTIPAHPTQTTWQEKPPKLEFVDPLDLDAHENVLNFIGAFAKSPENTDGAILLRSDAVYRQALATGHVVRGHHDEKTTFVQMVYLLFGEHRIYVELGTVVNRDVRRGLMEPVVRAVLIQLLKIWPAAHVFAVATPGTASAHVFSKVGMRPILPGPELIGLREHKGTPFSTHKKVFALNHPLRPDSML